LLAVPARMPTRTWPCPPEYENCRRFLSRSSPRLWLGIETLSAIGERTLGIGMAGIPGGGG